MNRRVAVAALAVFCILAFQAKVQAEAAKPPGGASAEIQKLEHELEIAIVKQDAGTIRRIEAEGYVHTDSDGVVSRREDFLRAYQAGTSPIVSLKFEDLAVDVYGNAAVVRGVLTLDLVINGQSQHRVSRYTRFYVRSEQGWQAVAGHSSPLKRPEQP
jgi:ketosteroid isomerase-like protein